MCESRSYCISSLPLGIHETIFVNDNSIHVEFFGDVAFGDDDFAIISKEKVPPSRICKISIARKVPKNIAGTCVLGKGGCQCRVQNLRDVDFIRHPIFIFIQIVTAQAHKRSFIDSEQQLVIIGIWVQLQKNLIFTGYQRIILSRQIQIVTLIFSLWEGGPDLFLIFELFARSVVFLDKEGTVVEQLEPIQTTGTAQEGIFGEIVVFCGGFSG